MSYPARAEGLVNSTYIQQLCTNTGCSLEDLLEAMDNREGWQERVREIHAGGTTWGWWDEDVWWPLHYFQIGFCIIFLWCTYRQGLGGMKWVKYNIGEQVYVSSRREGVSQLLWIVFILEFTNTIITFAHKTMPLAQSAGTVEYTNCFSAKV